jgi:hypothetical protein
MTIDLHSSADLWVVASHHLRGAPERVMFLTASTTDIVITDHLLIDDRDLEPGPWCVQLTDDAQQRVLQWAAAREGWLIELHSHLGAYGDPAQLSAVDTAGLKDWVPHVRWRLRQRPYAAVVFGPRTIDGVAWSGAKGLPPASIGSWEVDGTAVETTGLSVANFEERA